MYRHKKKHTYVERDNVDRWLVSYADYMTLMFALFVVLYAFSLLKDEQSRVITEKLVEVFRADEMSDKMGQRGEDILLTNSVETTMSLHGNAILDTPGPELVDGDKELSNLNKKLMGTPLATVEDELEEALFDLIENGKAKLESDEDWLTIELNSNMLFPSGSATVTNAAKQVIGEIAEIIRPLDNFVRIRGYTDNQPISNEIIRSNWQLSAMRSTAIVQELQSLNVNPVRLAIEAYGQYSPFVANDTPEGRAQNRKVVIAISKYGIAQPTLGETRIDSVEQLNSELSGNDG